MGFGSTVGKIAKAGMDAHKASKEAKKEAPKCRVPVKGRPCGKVIKVKGQETCGSLNCTSWATWHQG
jgi:hypothetical protein